MTQFRNNIVIMLDLNIIVIFARVVEAGSFSEAARRMNMSRSAVSKAIAKLEKSMDAQLLNRSTRHLSLTEAGTALTEHCFRIVDEAEEAERAVNSLQVKPRGLLKVSASVAFGTLHIAPALADFLAKFPEIKLDLTITDRPVDLIEEGYDVIIRVTGEPDPNLVAHKLAPVHRKLCATPQYFQRHGLPLTPGDLIRHNCLDYTLSGEQGNWRFTGPDGDISVPVSGTLRINDDDALSQAVLAGLGIALLPTFTIGKYIQQKQLQAVLSKYLPVERHVYASYLQSRHLPAKVRFFIDFLAARIGTIPYWDQSAL